MSEHESETEPQAGLEGADAAALGTSGPVETAPPGARVVDEERTVPGAGDIVPDEAKPWFTSLAAASDQAGVGNDDPDAQDPEFPTDTEIAR